MRKINSYLRKATNDRLRGALLLLGGLLLFGVNNAWADNILHGNFGSGWKDAGTFNYSGNYGTVDVYIASAGTYYFGLKDGTTSKHTWYSGSAFTSSDCTNKALATDQSNCSLNATVAGTYTFVLWWNSGVPTLSVAYPSGANSTYAVKFDNSEKNWSPLKAYVWNEFDGEKVSADWSGSEVTEHDGSIYAYSVTTDKVPTQIIWNNDDDNIKTSNLTYINGMTYKATSSGDMYISCERNLAIGYYGTVCIPLAGTLTGAKAYSIVGKDASNLYIEEVENGELVAGKPYIIKATDATQTITITNQGWEGTVQAANGLVGKYRRFPMVGLSDADFGNAYIITNTEIQKASRNSGVVAYRAYIDMGIVPNYNPSSAPGRPIIAMPFGGNGATSIDAIEASEKAVKFVENGKLLIKKNGVVYDTTGRVVR